MGLAEQRVNGRYSSPRLVARLARTGVLALVAGGLLAALFTARQAAQGNVPAALACGLGNPQTMLANKIPALLYPITPNMPQDAPQGVFPLDYAAGTTIAFTEDLSRVPGAPKLSSFRWKWNFGDGTGDVFTESPSHTFAKPGTYYVGSWVADSSSAGGWNPFDSAQIHIVNSIAANPPMAKASSNMAVTTIGQGVIFDATGSHANDGSQLKYLWNFNDGSTSTSPHVVHPFPINGSTFAALVVTDARGAQSMAMVNITIQAHAPTASLSASDLEVDAGSTVNFDASQSAPPTGVNGEAIVKYTWNFGDGAAPVTTQTATTSHRYANAGSYTVVLTVFDKAGEQASASLRVKVLGASAGVSPLVIIGGIALLAGLAIGGYVFWQQRRRVAMIRQYQEAQALARARRAQRGPRDPRMPGQSSGGYGTRSNAGSYGNGRQPTRYDRVPSAPSSSSSSSSPSSPSSPGQRRPPGAYGPPARQPRRPDNAPERNDW